MLTRVFAAFFLMVIGLIMMAPDFCERLTGIDFASEQGFHQAFEVIGFFAFLGGLHKIYQLGFEGPQKT